MLKYHFKGGENVFSYLFGLKSSWEILKDSPYPVAVYGTGDGADKVFSEFERLGIVPEFVTASDTFARERTFHGYKVLPIGELQKNVPNFIIALCFASGREEVIENIISLSKKHTVIIPSVPVCGNEIFNKDFLYKHFGEINSSYERLSDEQSKKVFKSIIEFQITGNVNLLFECETPKKEALRLLELSDSENYLDLGAYRGDTVAELIDFAGGYGSITAVEPDPRSFKKLNEAFGNLPNITLLNAAVSEKCGLVSFSGNKGRGGRIKSDGALIPSINVDSLNSNFTYIKADTEGEEMNLLSGAKNTLKNKPKLNIAAYHKSEDIFALVNKIAEINPKYETYLRHHRHISFWDTNLYCK